MRRGVKALLLALLVLAILLTAAGALFCWYVMKYGVTDRGGMENPNYTGGAEMLDGPRTYAGNGALLEIITGTWESADGRYGLTLREDCGVTLALDGENVLEGEIRFTYLLPEPLERTELRLEPCVFQNGGGSVSGEISGFSHQAGEEGGTLVLELADGTAIEFRKTAE